MSLNRQWASHGQWNDATDLLEGRLGPQSRPLMAIGNNSAPWQTILYWRELPKPQAATSLLLSIAIEDRDAKRLHFRDAETGELLSELEVICADNYQVLDVPFSPDSLAKIDKHGLKIELVEGSRPLWLFAPQSGVNDGLELHLPRLVSSFNVADELQMQSTLGSLASLQSFGWKEGCVLDALWEQHRNHQSAPALTALKKHLDYFGFSEGQLCYETPRNQRVTDNVYGIEGALPFAHAARLDANHPWVDLAVQFWKKYLTDGGIVADHDVITAEGAYTIAYPMAVVGQLRGDKTLTHAAEELLIETYKRLFRSDGIYLRHFANDSRTHRNWARGVAWLLLGHAQTLRCEIGRRDQLTTQFQTLAAYVAKHQLSNGLWACYTDEPTIAVDTAGSAGIGAALAIGAAEMWLPAEHFEVASRTYRGLLSNLTPEGFLNGCAQSNKGGEELQRGNYRVISPYALGLMGLLQSNL